MNKNVLRVHVLYESSSGGLPHGCSMIRLIRPLLHPSINSKLSLTYGSNIPDDFLDILIIERFWDQTCDWQRDFAFLKDIRERGTKIIYEIDDDLLSLDLDNSLKNYSTISKKIWLRQIIRFSDSVIVSTKGLAERLKVLNPEIEIIENALDENLFEKSQVINSNNSNGTIVFGYMGTLTHLDDLMSIIQPLRNFLALHRDKVRFEIVGVGNVEILKTLFFGLPVNFLSVPPSSVSYEEFTDWMQENVKWDFGIAPLIDNQFTRSKSDMKFLDYGVQGIPGIFSDVPSYNTSVMHLLNGVLVSDLVSWGIWLERMAFNHQLRISMSKEAHDYVWKMRMLNSNAMKWLNVLNKIASKKSTSNSFAISNNNPLLNRNEKILYGCDLFGIGLEIGASYSPVAPKKHGFRVEVLDHADSKTLKEKYMEQGVDISNIEEVDYIWTGQPLHELTKKENYFDWIIASHVIEHTPDLVSFLSQCETMLKPNGVLCLAVPDHRYCFDIYRPASTPGDVIQAYIEKRKKHTFGAIWDHFSMITKKGDLVSWHKGYQGGYELIHPNIADARSMLSKAQETSEYIDVHNWKFTPSSFKLILNDISILGFTSLSINSFFDTVGCEFILQLKKSSAKNISNKQRFRLVHNMLQEAQDLTI